MRYALIDTANTFFRMKHVASRSQDAWEKVGIALHLTLASVNMVAKKFKVDHVVFALEGKSWRKEFYTPYKAHRVVDNQALTESEVEENQLFYETFNTFITFLVEKTNVSVIRNEHAEADDIIARFIHLHPEDEHYIISSDTDYLQLITENVRQYNGVTNQLITIDGYYDDKDRPVIDKKTNKHKKLDDPGYILFEKCIRGDSTDNVFSAFPGARSKSSSKTTGLIEAYADKTKKGFAWNNIMMQRWVDHNKQEHKVADDYERNRKLIDLTAQPDDIKNEIDDSIKNTVRWLIPNNNVGIYFLKFCSKYELARISDQANTYVKWLNSPYIGILRN